MSPASTASLNVARRFRSVGESGSGACSRSRVYESSVARARCTAALTDCGVVSRIEAAQHNALRDREQPRRLRLRDHTAAERCVRLYERDLRRVFRLVGIAQAAAAVEVNLGVVPLVQRRQARIDELSSG